MSFNIEELKIELEKYGTIVDCTIYHGTNLEVFLINGAATTNAIMINIENTFILPYFPNRSDHIYDATHYKGAFQL
jgi:hypothetical protein